MSAAGRSTLDVFFALSLLFLLSVPFVYDEKYVFSIELGGLHFREPTV